MPESVAKTIIFSFMGTKLFDRVAITPKYRRRLGNCGYLLFFDRLSFLSSMARKLQSMRQYLSTQGL